MLGFINTSQSIHLEDNNMSTLETIIWNILGYGSMPMILLGGFIGTAVIACFLLEKTGKS